MTSKKLPLLIISGATATGKTSTSLHLAKKYQHLSPVIINVDSLLFYRELNIGTAKPSQQERDEIEHRLIDNRSINNPLNAADFTTLALKELEQCFENQRFPILVGGSGFYLRALVKGMYDSVDVSEEIKNDAEELFEREGIKPFIEFLNLNDPIRMKTLHENDHYRIKRAYEHFKMTGKPTSQAGDQFAGGDPYDFSQHRLDSWNILHLYMELPRDEHAQIIKDRTEQMLTSGFVEETKTLLNNGFTGQEKPMQSIGYKEILMMLYGELEQKDLQERIEGSTRKLAKQQRTFFAKIRPKHSLHPLKDKVKIDQLVSDWMSEGDQ